SGENKEWKRQWMQFSCKCYRPLLHRFQQCRLSFWRRPVDFISKNDIGEHGPLVKIKLPRLIHHFTANDITRHEIRGELDALERKVKHICNGFNQQCFCKTRHSHQQTMSVTEYRGEDKFNGFALSHNYFADFSRQFVK